jgi:cell division protein FtsW
VVAVLVGFLVFQVPFLFGEGRLLGCSLLPWFADDGVVAIHWQGRERGSPLDLAWFMNFQPSELAKFATVLYAADYMVRKMDERAILSRRDPHGHRDRHHTAVAGRTGHGLSW